MYIEHPAENSKINKKHFFKKQKRKFCPKRKQLRDLFAKLLSIDLAILKSCLRESLTTTIL